MDGGSQDAKIEGGAFDPEERFRMMADSAPAPVWITAASGAITFVNQAFAELTGKPRHELLGDAWIALLHPDDLAGVASRRSAAWANNFAPYEIVARFRDAQGGWRWMRANSQPRFDEKGAFRGYIGMALDETATRTAEAELRESERRLRLVQEAGEIGSFDWDLRTGNVYRSAEYLALQGVGGVAGNGQYDESWIDRVHPDDREQVRIAFLADLARSGPFEHEYRIVRPDNGETRWILNRGRVEADAEGKPVRLLSAQSDITRQKNTEQALRQANDRLQRLAADRGRQLEEQSSERQVAEQRSLQMAEQFRLLVQGVVDYAIYMLDPNGCITTWNPGAERIKSYAETDVLGKHFSMFFTEEDRAAGVPDRALETAARTGRYESEGWRVRKDGTRFYAAAVLDAITDTRGKLIGFAKITRDITEKMERARELEQAREALVQAQKMEMVGQLTGGLAHDFNNMLAGIIGALNLMQRRLERQRYDDLPKYLDAALVSANRAASLTSRLLAFGRRQSLDIKPVNVETAVRSMEILLTRSLGENMSLEIKLQPALALTDSNQLATAILNLIVNARDAMPDGGKVTLETRARDDGFVDISVSDTGVGMAPSVVERVFEPFFTTKPIGQGTGLGLSMVHGFVKQSGGDISVQSAPGKGTKVTLSLPLAGAGATEAEAPERHVAEEGAGERVLVVEDDEQVRMVVLDVLRELGYRPREAADAQSAFKILDHERFDLLITDVGLPGINGRQLAEMARSRHLGLKVLFITGYAEHATLRSTFLGPDMDLVSKPFDMDVWPQKFVR